MPPRSPMRGPAPLLIACALSAACGGSGPPLLAGNGGGSSATSDGDAGDPAGHFGEVAPSCTAAAALVYVLSEENDLYSFDPGQKVFTKIGTLDCAAPGLFPNSMAVARDATAWVNYAADDDSAGALFEVSTRNASCRPLHVDLQRGWARLGMGFSSDRAGSDTETLFLSATGGRTFGRFDRTTLKLTPIGALGDAQLGGDAELTGTGDGTLFGFFTTSPMQVVAIDKATGATANAVAMTGLDTPKAWAFSYWGGEFYLYTWAGAANRTSRVTHYVPSTGAIDTAYMGDVGFIIVGAGVSTCAPTTPPTAVP